MPVAASASNLPSCDVQRTGVDRMWVVLLGEVMEVIADTIALHKEEVIYIGAVFISCKVLDGAWL